MLDRLDAIEKHYEELHNQMADASVTSNPVRLREITREISGLEPTIAKYRESLQIPPVNLRKSI